MLIIKHTEETKATPADIWKVWADVMNWNTWDHGIEWSSLDGDFVEGTTGTLQVKEGPLVHLKLTHVEPLKMFVDETKLFLARIIDSHYIIHSEEKIQVVHQIEMKGPLAFLFAYLIGRSMKKNLPQEMRSMVKKAERLSTTKDN